MGWMPSWADGCISAARRPRRRSAAASRCATAPSAWPAPRSISVRGRITFTGTGLAHKIDPALDFQADSTSGNVTASVVIGGYADKPTFKLISSPQLPQDEVLAHLLFGRSVKNLGPFQYAQIAQALASLSGANSSVTDPLSSIRRGWGWIG